MTTFFTTYTYMSFSLLLLAIWAACWWQSDSQRSNMLWSSILAAPFGFLSIFFVPYYWDPIRLIEFGTGLEDLIFSFAGGGIAWSCATYPFRHRLHLQFDRQRLIIVYLATCAAGILFGWLLNLAGTAPMAITFAGFAFAVTIYLLLRRSLLTLMLAGAGIYGTFYLLICLLAFNLQPEFINQWNLLALSGIVWLGIPIEELGWGIGFGAAWPLIFGYGINLQLTAPSGAECGEAHPMKEQPA